MTASLSDIRNKTRLITKRPSSTQLTDTQLDFYINTFYLYDFPEEIRLKDMLTNYTFVTQPYREAYDLPIVPTSTTSTATPAAPSYTSIGPPFYVGGYQGFFTQDQDQFYRLYPPLAMQSQTITADGTNGPYQFTLSNFPVMAKRVVVSVSDGVTGENLIATDEPPVAGTIGSFIGDVDNTYLNSIDYSTGLIDIKFSAATEAGAPINVQIVPYQPSKPTAMLFFQNQMILRPIPDNTYQISVQAYQTFTQFLSANPAATPYIQQWWQFIALGAALKIFEDVGDIEAIMQYRPIFEEQRALVLRRTLVQQSSQRAATIYSEQSTLSYGNFFGVQ